MAGPLPWWDAAWVQSVGALVTALCTGAAAIAGARWGRTRQDDRTAAHVDAMAAKIEATKALAADASAVEGGVG